MFNFPIFSNFHGVTPDFPPKLDTLFAVEALTAVVSRLEEA